MWTNRTTNQPNPDTNSKSGVSTAKQIGRGLVLAGALAAVSLTAAPTAAYARNDGVAIGLGVLGGVLAGAAIASSAPPVYYATPPAYNYPPQGYYAPPAGYYYQTQPYYGYTQYNYGYYR